MNNRSTRPLAHLAAGGAAIDLHAHSSLGSLDSGLMPDVLVERCLALGLSAACVTEHNAVWSRREAREAEERYGIPVLRGMEVSTDAGHVLVFGVERFSMEMYSLETLRRIVKSERGAMVIAHPLRDGSRFTRAWADAPAFFDAIEAVNGEDHRGAFDSLVARAVRLGLGSTGGSDAHSAPGLGRALTLFEEAVETDADLVRALHGRRYRPHSERIPGSPADRDVRETLRRGGQAPRRSSRADRAGRRVDSARPDI